MKIQYSVEECKTHTHIEHLIEHHICQILQLIKLEIYTAMISREL